MIASTHHHRAAGHVEYDSGDLVLFALTSFEMFDALSVRRRSDTAVEADPDDRI